MEEQDMLGVVEINTGPLDDEFHNARDHPLSNGVRPAFFSEEWTAISEDPCFFPRFAGKVTRFLLSRPPPFFRETSHDGNLPVKFREGHGSTRTTKCLAPETSNRDSHKDFWGYYNRLVVFRSKRKNGDRFLDVSRLNKFMILTKSKMKSPTSVLQSVRPLDWMTSIDLSDAHFMYQYIQDPENS